MQILEVIRISISTYFCQVQASGIDTVSLPFNPIKLFLLVLWAYICMYFVQRLQFSPLMPYKYKSAVYIITLFTGPIFWLILLIVDTAKKSAQTNKSIFELSMQLIKKAMETIKSKTLKHSRHGSDIKLFDSSGRNFDEIYGHSDNKRQDNRILDLTENIIANALDKRASDILIDPKDEISYTIRLRIDGVLRTVKELKSNTCKAVVNSIKAISSMDISEKRRPQDGAFIAKKDKKTSSFRVASAGVVNGEKLSIRILNQDAGTSTLMDIGLTKKQYSVFTETMKMPSGMILLCGPTGSGKTTTLYAMLNEIDRSTRNIITVEDPIEAVLPATSQIEINTKADITFAKSLRSILRQDPDVICVGEIRDEETAEIALRAAQTGHLVIATIHCDSNKTALIRLLDLGISPLLLSSGLTLLSSQRLLRRLCKHCKKPARISDSLIEEFKKIGLKDYSHIYKAAGCRHCDGTGYYGRTAACDILPVNEQLKNDIRNIELASDVNTENRLQIKSRLRKEALKKVAVGITSLEELKRVIG
ncbi:MAG: type II/IV secretion system protein [Sedimentisphaerales bacterium]|nr:type II/IV secretion system protein [Sedimentisphaerales bacterium]